VAQGELGQAMARASFFLLMSAKPYERLPNVVKEAMYKQCVCVVADSPGMNELITSDELGFIVDEENDHRVAELLIRLAGDEDRRQTIGRSARAHIEEHFNCRVQMEKYLAEWR
jgi:glycosyltransferase involved in cell wall biosynthesis